MSRIAIVCCALLLAACGSKGSSNNVDPNNTSPNNTSPNNTSGPNNTTGGPNNTTGGPNNTTGAPNNTTGAPNNTTGAPNNTTGPNNVPGELTWHEHVRPIVEAECGACHFDGGIGPFALTSYEEVQPLSALIASAVTSEVMPPWPPADNCGEFQYERKLDDAEKATILNWIAAGAPEGDGADYVPPTSEEVDLGPPDYVADIGIDYMPDPPNGGIDDYHCFIIEHGLDEDKFLNAFQVRAGDVASVHHVLFWQIDNSQLAANRAKESSPGSGYTCFGGNGNDASTELGLIGGWVPGSLPLQFGPGQGMEIPQDSFLVVQIHYNTINGISPDRTQIDMWFTDGPATTELAMYPLADTGIQIPAGRVDDKTDENDARGEFTFNLPIPVTIYGVVPHMHTLGSRIKVEIGDQCLIDIPDWDFNWQGFYLFEQPIQVSAGSRIKMNCWYDNSAANQQQGRTPEDVSWGDGTYDEMCLNYVITQALPF